MGLKYYLNLFKKDANCEAVKFRYYFNIFIFLAYMLMFAVFISLRHSYPIVSSVFGVLALLMIILQRILHACFSRFVCMLASEEQLDEADEVDAAFSAYRKGYAAFNQETKKSSKKMLPLDIILATAYFGLLLTSIIANLAGFAALADNMITAVNLVLILFFVIVIITAIVSGKKGVWFQNYTSELAVINKFKSLTSGVQQKYKILEDKKADKQMEYMLPNSGLQKKYKKITKSLSTSMIIGFVIYIIVLIIVLASTASDEKNEGEMLGPVVGIFILLLMAVCIFVGIAQKRIINKQRQLLKENEEENSLYLKLHELRTPFTKRWNILFIVSFFASIVSNLILAGIVEELAKTARYGWIFFLLFFAELIATFVIYFKSFGKVRQKMIVIETEIDRIKFETNRLIYQAATQQNCASEEDEVRQDVTHIATPPPNGQ